MTTTDQVKDAAPQPERRRKKINFKVYRGEKKRKTWLERYTGSCFSLNTQDASSFKIVNQAVDPMAHKSAVVHNIKINTDLYLKYFKLYSISIL